MEPTVIPRSSELLRDEILGRPIGRRSFLKICTLAAAAVGLPASAAKLFAEQAAAGLKPSVIWLSFQECTGCTESLLRTAHPALDELILDLISLDYHEALMVPSGHLAEEARIAAMNRHDGQFVLVVEGAIPTAEDGIYCQIGGRTALDLVTEAAERAGAIIAIGSCASWGGLPSADPNPTGAKGAPEVLAGKTVVTIPGCPANP
jgi:hydrogenase small subunit